MAGQSSHGVPRLHVPRQRRLRDFGSELKRDGANQPCGEGSFSRRKDAWLFAEQAVIVRCAIGYAGAEPSSGNAVSYP